MDRAQLNASGVARNRTGTAAVPDVLGEILTAAQLAKMLCMQRSTIEDYGRRGIIPSIKLGRHRRYIRSDVVDLLEALR